MPTPRLADAAAALDAGQPAVALEVCGALLANAPDDADALNLAGIAQVQLGNAEDGLDLLRTAVAFRPGDAGILSNLGNALAGLGRIEDAEHAYRDAMAADGDDAEAPFNLGLLRERLGDATAAVRWFERALALKPDHPSAAFALAGALKALGRLADAARVLEDLLARQPAHVDALNNLGTVRAEAGDHAAAAGLYHRVLDIAPAHIDARYNLGVAMQEDGHIDEALDAYDRVIAADAGHPAAHVNRGDALRALGRLDDAEAAFRRAMDLAPGFAKVRANLADLMLQRGDAAGALGIAEDFLVANPGDTMLLAMREMILRQLGRTDDARALLDYARLLDAGDIAVPPAYADRAAFNAALSGHVEGHPSLVEAPARHATRQGRHSGELLVDPKGPMADLETIIRGRVDAYLARIGDDAGHPFVQARPADYELSVWGVVMRRQGHQVAHIHPAAWLGGVYYARVPDAVAADDPDHAGWIEFGRPPDDYHVTAAPNLELVRPREGLMLLFPAYFYHRTVPYDAEATRISIAFDIIPV